MTGVDGVAAAQTMRNFRTWRKGHCLEAVWAAFKVNGARTDQEAATATIGWHLSDGKHPGDRNPPAGVPVWWGPKPSSAAGDVVISLGGGRVVATDWPYNGVIGVTTIDARERQIGRPYLGWTETILDVPIDYPGKGGGPAPIPTTSKESSVSEQIRVNQEDSSLFGLIAQVGPDYFAALPSESSADVVKNVFSVIDERHELSEIEFFTVTDTCGIPRDQVKAGNYWTRDQDNQRAIALLAAQVAKLVPTAR